VYSVDDEGVYLTMVPAFSDNPTERLQEAEPLLLLPGYKVEFSYLYEELDENKYWREDWKGDELLSLPLAVYVLFEPMDDNDNKEALEIVARIRSNEHRSIRPNTSAEATL
jgi:hypothetical protein